MTADKTGTMYQNRTDSPVDYMSYNQKYIRLKITGHLVAPRSDGILGVHFSMAELRQRQVKGVASELNINSQTNYINHTLIFRYIMSKGTKKGGEAEPKPAPPQTAPPVGPPGTTPPPRQTPSGVTGNPTVAPVGPRNARAEALKATEKSAKRDMTAAKDSSNPAPASKPAEAPFKPDGPVKFPPPKED